MVCVQIQSGLGKLILKEEMEKEQIRDRHSRSLSAQRYDPKQTNCDGGKERLRSTPSTAKPSQTRHATVG